MRDRVTDIILQRKVPPADLDPLLERYAALVQTVSPGESERFCWQRPHSAAVIVQLLAGDREQKLLDSYESLERATDTLWRQPEIDLSSPAQRAAALAKLLAELTHLRPWREGERLEVVHTVNGAYPGN